jgi:hypothetical protein
MKRPHRPMLDHCRWEAARFAMGHGAVVSRAPNREEQAMRLTSEQVERTLDQFDAQAIPEDHPVLPRLNELFGDHTFFLNSNGLNVVEPTEPASGADTGMVVNLADWSDENRTKLAEHPPQATEIVVMLGPRH